MSISNCSMCGVLADAAPPEVVVKSPLWTAGVFRDVPGWIVVRTTEHVEAVWDLSDDHAATLGELVVALSRAVRAACAAERVYLASFGENHAHFHLLVVPRSAGVAVVDRGAALLARVGSLADRQQALDVAQRIRGSLAGEAAGAS